MVLCPYTGRNILIDSDAFWRVINHGFYFDGSRFYSPHTPLSDLPARIYCKGLGHKDLNKVLFR